MQADKNPFATDRVERLLSFRPGWAGLTWRQLDNQWREADYRGSITGRHGSGKTTLISEWKQRLTINGADIIDLFLNTDSKSLQAHQWSALASEKVKNQLVILDGEEQLSYLHKRKFYKLTQRAKGVIITRHRKNHLRTLTHLDTNIETLHQCVQEIAPKDYDKLEPFLESCWKDKKGNIREILLSCYDLV